MRLLSQLIRVSLSTHKRHDYREGGDMLMAFSLPFPLMPQTWKPLLMLPPCLLESVPVCIFVFNSQSVRSYFLSPCLFRRMWLCVCSRNQAQSSAQHTTRHAAKKVSPIVGREEASLTLEAEYIGALSSARGASNMEKQIKLLPTTLAWAEVSLSWMFLYPWVLLADL